jgi:integrase
LNTLTVVRNGLNFALEKEMIAATPFVNIRLPKPPETEELRSYASPRAQRLLLVTAPYKWRPMLAFAIGSGLRAGELVTLRFRDVHTDAAEPSSRCATGAQPTGHPRTAALVTCRSCRSRSKRWSRSASS